EAAVEFQYLGRAVSGNHHPGVEEAGVDIAFVRHAAHGGIDHLVHDARFDLGGDHRGRGVGTHAAGIGALVAIVAGLVILGRGHRQDILAIHHADEAGFFAHQELLHHHPAAGITELV